MHQAFTRVQSTQKTQSRQRMLQTALSLFIGGLFCSAAPAWADCTVSGTPNANGGVDITCVGTGITQDTSLLGNQSNNTVTVQGQGSTVSSEVYGGNSSVVSGNKVSVSGNAVTLNDSSSVYSSVYGSWVNGDGFSESSIIGNTVTLNDSSHVNQSLVGGYSRAGDDSITGNTVTLNDSSSVGRNLYGGFTEGGNAPHIVNHTITGNAVTLNDNSSVGGDIYGGNHSGSADNIAITGNTVTLNDSSSVGGDIYGGTVTLFDSIINATVTGNTVNINDTAHPFLSLYGSFINLINIGGGTADSYDGFTGNTLNFAAAPITLSGTVANFENYNFTVDPTLVNTDTALITADTIIFGTNETNMKGGDANTSKIKVVGIKAGNELFADDKFVLMQATGTMSGAAEGLATNGVAQQGISLLYDVRTDVDTNGKLVTATIIGKEKPVDPEKPVVPPVEPGKPAARVNPQLKSLSEGHLASAMMITRGADTLAYDTINTIKQQNQAKGWAPFINLSGDKTRYNSGSHINAKDALLTGGVSYQVDKLTSAVLIESGWGSYDTHNSFNTMNSVKGDGHNRYLGLGVLSRYDFESGVYADASLRGGQNRNTFDTKDIQNLTTGERVHYNLDSNYVSAHVGTGYTKALDEKNTLDVSAKYLWTQLKGKDVNIAGDKIRFDDINSHRVRLNAGVAHQSTKAGQLRAGLGYEYEFDGKAKASTYGYDIAAPSVQGSTAIMTVGATMTPMANQAFSIDVNANGYTGQRDGIGGNIKFSYTF